jgi:hypothetical protein
MSDPVAIGFWGAIGAIATIALIVLKRIFKRKDEREKKEQETIGEDVARGPDGVADINRKFNELRPPPENGYPPHPPDDNNN